MGGVGARSGGGFGTFGPSCTLLSPPVYMYADRRGLRFHEPGEIGVPRAFEPGVDRSNRCEYRCASGYLPGPFRAIRAVCIFRTVPGTKLDAATIGAVVAFQADAPEPLDGSPWTVLLQGVPSPVTDGWDQSKARSVWIRTWSGIDEHRHRLVRLEATNVSGRRFRIAGEGPSVELPDAPTL